MGKTKDLQSFLRDKVRTGGKNGKSSEPDWNTRLSKWRTDVSELYAMIRKWLAPLEADGTVSFLNSELKLTEDLIGTYEIDALAILIGKQRVAFYPKGTLIVGAEGRVDIRGQNAVRTIILNDGQWLVVQTTPKIRTLPFDQDSFQRILGEVML